MKILLKQCQSILKKCFEFIDRHKLMTRLDRYFLKEFFKTHFITLVIVYIILLINNFILMMPILISLQIRFLDIVGLMISLTPSTILWALPFSVLLGTLLFIGRLAQNNEITAAACLGVNKLQLFKPFLIYGVCVGIGSYILDTGISPETNKLFNKISSRIAAAAPHVIIESESSTIIGDTLMTTGTLSEEGILQGITIIEKQPDGDTKVIHAKQGMLLKIKNLHESVLNLKEIQGIIASPNINSSNYQVIIANEALYRFNIKPSTIGVSTTFSSKTIGETFKNFLIRKKDFKKSELDKVVQGKKWQDDLGDMYLEAEQYPQVANNKLPTIFQNYKNSFAAGGSVRTKFVISIIEFYQKISLIISSLIFVLFAVSLAISRQKIYQTTIMAIGGILCVSYWFSYHLTITLIISYKFSSLVIASSDAAFLIASLILLRKVRL